MSYPQQRLNRYRQSPGMRRLFQEIQLNTADFVQPIFINETLTEAVEIPTLPGIKQWSLNDVLTEVDEIATLGIPAIILFGIPAQKDEKGFEAYNPTGIIQQAAKLIKEKHPDLVIIADCCLCEYTDHGHCHVVTEQGFNNDVTNYLLGKTAVTYARAGVDIIAPSGMMDGMVKIIRETLDKADYKHTLIMSYAVKYASTLYGPFRDAAGSSDAFNGDRLHHQLQPTQRNEALEEARLDEEESADILMLKPASLYLDILRDIRESSNKPLAVYQVSGEYAMIKAAHEKGILNEADTFYESFIAMKRAGAKTIITYYAKDIAKAL